MNAPSPPLKPTTNTRLLHPTTGLPVFGVVPQVKFRGVFLPSAEIVLLHGRPQFGAVHIWKRHASDMRKRGLNNLDHVSEFVSMIVRPWAPLHLEGGHRNDRLTVVQSSSGTAILELREHDFEPVFYSVVTAFLGQRRQGPRVGKLLG